MSLKSYLNKFGLNKILSAKGFFGFLKIGNRKHSTNFDEVLIQSLRGKRLPSLVQLKYLDKYLNPKEKKALLISLAILVVTGSFLMFRFYVKHLETVPATGGTYVESEIGYPKYINPLYSSINPVDMDLEALIYSSLFKTDSSGNVVNDLVETATVSPDGKTHTLSIKRNAQWHNGSLLTASDVAFTFNAIKDSSYKSPLRESFQGSEVIVKDDYTMEFVLKEPYAGFPNLLTFGIMSQELWGQLTPGAASLTDLNLKPVGSGPFKFKSLIKDKNGNLKAMNLVANTQYFEGRPFIDNFQINFYPSYEESQVALNDGLADGMSFYENQFSVDGTSKSFLNTLRLQAPQIKGFFMNAKSDFLSDAKIRQAISLTFDKASLLAQDSKITKIDAFILPGNKYYSDNYKKYTPNLAEAKAKIEAAGWKLVDVTAEDLAKADELIKSGDAKKRRAGESYKQLGLGKWYYKDGYYLIIKISTVDTPDNQMLANGLAKSLEQVRIKATVEVVPANQLQNDVVKPRDYDILLAGLILSSDADPYLYWHSSQIGADGLNLANFSNKEVDKLLEEGRLTSSNERRKAVYERFLNLMADQAPAIYLYSTDFIYLQNKKLKNNNNSVIFTPSDRFYGVKDWYVKVEKSLKW